MLENWKTNESQCVIVDMGEIMTIKVIRIQQTYNNLTGKVKAFNVYERPQFFLFK